MIDFSLLCPLLFSGVAFSFHHLWILSLSSSSQLTGGPRIPIPDVDMNNLDVERDGLESVVSEWCQIIHNQLEAERDRKAPGADSPLDAKAQSERSSKGTVE